MKSPNLHKIGSEYYTQQDLADLLGVSVKTVQRWDARRIGPPRTKIGKRVLYRRESVEAWLEANEQGQVRGAANA